MSIWIFIGIVAAIKLPIAVLMLWIPMRADRTAPPPATSPAGDDEGGSGPEPPGRGRPRQPMPRRGPHGTPALPAPPRVREPWRRRAVRARTPAVVGPAHA